MKKTKKLDTVSSRDKIDTKLLSKQVSKLIEESAPKNILGLLALGVNDETGVILGNRWRLSAVDKNDYFIIDLKSGDVVYEHIALLANALNIIWWLSKPITSPKQKDRIIYELDQEYYRCLEDVKYYRAKKAKDPELQELFAIRLGQSKFRLQDIKNEISKIY
jgi:hypothetical protein